MKLHFRIQIIKKVQLKKKQQVKKIVDLIHNTVILKEIKHHQNHHREILQFKTIDDFQ